MSADRRVEIALRLAVPADVGRTRGREHEVTAFHAWLRPQHGAGGLRQVDGMRRAGFHPIARYAPQTEIVGKFGRAGKLPKEFGMANAIDCRTENELWIAELTNWRAQKVTLRK